MQISLDARWLKTGIGRYVEGVLAGLRGKLNGIDLHVLTMAAYSDRVADLCDHVSFCDAPIYSLREQIGVPWKCRNSGLLHVPHYNAPLIWNKKLVVTIHDLIHLENPARYAALVYAGPMLKAVTRKADAIITVSRSVKTRLVDELKVPGDKIRVIYNGVDPSFRPGEKAAARSDFGEILPSGKILLAIGNNRPHKNLRTLVQAFESATGALPSDWKLMLIAEGAGELIERTKIPERIVGRDRVSEEQLRLIYRAADAFIMPSLNEGFGLPIIEAMASGLPVLCSDIEVFREVAGENAQYFNPRSATDMARTIVEALNAPQCLQSLADGGKMRASLFSWESCGREHAEVYRSVLQANDGRYSRDHENA
jgi:glycosyltransferase involved in cell wall biosynthesis